MKKSLTICIAILIGVILILLNAPKLELLAYRVITQDDIDYLVPSTYSVIAVNEGNNSYTYHVFSKDKRKVMLDNHIEIKYSKQEIDEMKTLFTKHLGSFTLLSDYPYLRNQVQNLTLDNVNDMLYHSFLIEDEKNKWYQVEVNYISNQVIIFDGYKHQELVD